MRDFFRARRMQNDRRSLDADIMGPADDVSADDVSATDERDA